MRLNERDLAYLIDMVDCVLDITEFVDGINFIEFEKDKMRKLAVERQLEVIGQAGNNISKETQNIMSDISWGHIIGLRNKLAHDYGEILAERIWTVSKKSIPDLLEKLQKVDEIKKYIEDKRI